MANVTMRELRNHGAQVIERVAAGETLTVTRGGEPVAELRPLPRRPTSAQALLGQWATLAPIDSDQLRRDADAFIDQTL